MRSKKNSVSAGDADLGIKGLDVVVEGDIGGMDLACDQLKTEIEEKLKHSGLNLANTSEKAPSSNTSALQLNIHVSRGRELLVCNTVLRFQEAISQYGLRQSSDSNSHPEDVAVWNRGSIEYRSLSEDPKRKIHNTAKELADEFINDVLVTNSKPSG